MPSWNSLSSLSHSEGIRTSDLVQPEVSNMICHPFCRKRKALGELEGKHPLQKFQKREEFSREEDQQNECQSLKNKFLLFRFLCIEAAQN